MLGIACGFTYWAANYNNREPTPIDGAWDVAQAEPDLPEAMTSATIFFEHNRAYMTVFRMKGGSWQTHHFTVDATHSGIRIWERWLRKGRKSSMERTCYLVRN